MKKHILDDVKAFYSQTSNTFSIYLIITDTEEDKAKFQKYSIISRKCTLLTVHEFLDWNIQEAKSVDRVGLNTSNKEVLESCEILYHDKTYIPTKIKKTIMSHI
jgi:hypothetical protein